MPAIMLRFGNGRSLTLTPAYDICPQARTGLEASQAMLIHGADRTSRLKTCLDASAAFLLDTSEANALIHSEIQPVEHHWQAICDEAELSSAERQFLWGRQFLNPFAFQGLST